MKYSYQEADRKDPTHTTLPRDDKKRVGKKEGQRSSGTMT